MMFTMLQVYIEWECFTQHSSLNRWQRSIASLGAEVKQKEVCPQVYTFKRCTQQVPALKGLGHVTVNKRFVRDSLRVRGILFTSRQGRVSDKLAGHETLMLAAMLPSLNYF